MVFKNKQILILLIFVMLLSSFTSQSQELPKIKLLEDTTLDIVKIDFDNDGDLDVIVAGVFSIRDQGRIYLIENKGSRYNKPEYIYSYPTIPLKQHLNVEQKDDFITIITTGISPAGKETKYTGTLHKGVFVGLLLPPATATVDN